MSFTRMDQSTESDWQAIFEAGRPYAARQADRILTTLEQLRHLKGAYSVDQLTHSLQTARLAERAGASDELVVAALCHDVGKVFSIQNHGAIAAEILQPFVSEATYRIILHHQDFQGRYYYAYKGLDPEARARFAREPWFAEAERFTDEWDQAAFDPEGETPPLSHFEARVRAVFASPKRRG